MSTLLHRVTFWSLHALGVLLACSILFECWPQSCLMSIAHAQSLPVTNTKTIIMNRQTPLDAVEVIQVMEALTATTPGDPSPEDLRWLPRGPRPAREWRWVYKFEAGDDWLKNLSLELRNRTSEDIVYLSIKMCFPETVMTGPKVCPNVVLGQLPEKAAYTITGEKIPPAPREPLLLAPGKTLTVSFGADESGFRAAINRRQPFSTVSQCQIDIDLYFENGIRWNGHEYYAPDPNNPGRYKPMEGRYFPGRLVGK